MIELGIAGDPRETAVVKTQTQPVVPSAVDFQKLKGCGDWFEGENASIGENSIEQQHEHADVRADVNNAISVFEANASILINAIIEDFAPKDIEIRL